MDYRDDEYLKLFKQIKEKNQPKVEEDQLLTSNFSGQMLKETPNYDNYNNINEVQRNNYSQDLNLNEFNIETRINGENINEIKRQEKERRLNEVMQHRREEEARLREEARLNEIKKQEEQRELQKLNEVVSFNDADVVSLEMFERARYNFMMGVAHRILPK